MQMSQSFSYLYGAEPPSETHELNESFCKIYCLTCCKVREIGKPKEGRKLFIYYYYIYVIYFTGK